MVEIWDQGTHGKYDKFVRLNMYLFPYENLYVGKHKLPTDKYTRKKNML